MDEPFTIEIQDYGILVRFQSGTELSPELIIRAIERENELHELHGRQDLWDFRDCRISVDFGYDAVLKVVDHIQNKYHDDWAAKSGILVDETIKFGLSRMFQQLIDDYPTQIGVFQDESAARQWVGQKLDEKGGIP